MTQLDARKIRSGVLILISALYIVYVLFERGWEDFFTIVVTGLIALGIVIYFRALHRNR